MRLALAAAILCAVIVCADDSTCVPPTGDSWANDAVEALCAYSECLRRHCVNADVSFLVKLANVTCDTLAIGCIASLFKDPLFASRFVEEPAEDVLRHYAKQDLCASECCSPVGCLLFEQKYCAANSSSNLPKVHGSSGGQIGRSWSVPSVSTCVQKCADLSGCTHYSYTESNNGDCLLYDTCPAGRTYGDGAMGTVTYSMAACQTTDAATLIENPQATTHPSSARELADNESFVVAVLPLSEMDENASDAMIDEPPKLLIPPNVTDRTANGSSIAASSSLDEIQENDTTATTTSEIPAKHTDLSNNDSLGTFALPFVAPRDSGKAAMSTENSATEVLSNVTDSAANGSLERTALPYDESEHGETDVTTEDTPVLRNVTTLATNGSLLSTLLPFDESAEKEKAQAKESATMGVPTNALDLPANGSFDVVFLPSSNESEDNKTAATTGEPSTTGESSSLEDLTDGNASMYGTPSNASEMDDDNIEGTTTTEELRENGTPMDVTGSASNGTLATTSLQFYIMEDNETHALRTIEIPSNEIDSADNGSLVSTLSFSKPDGNKEASATQKQSTGVTSDKLTTLANGSLDIAGLSSDVTDNASAAATALSADEAPENETFTTRVEPLVTTDESSVPTLTPTITLASTPTPFPTSSPPKTPLPTLVQTPMPTLKPVPTPLPTSVQDNDPTRTPTSIPTPSVQTPTLEPIGFTPTRAPTSLETALPTMIPTQTPTLAPSPSPTPIPPMTCADCEDGCCINSDGKLDRAATKPRCEAKEYQWCRPSFAILSFPLQIAYSMDPLALSALSQDDNFVLDLRAVASWVLTSGSSLVDYINVSFGSSPARLLMEAETPWRQWNGEETQHSMRYLAGSYNITVVYLAKIPSDQFDTLLQAPGVGVSKTLFYFQSFMRNYAGFHVTTDSVERMTDSIKSARSALSPLFGTASPTPSPPWTQIPTLTPTPMPSASPTPLPSLSPTPSPPSLEPTLSPTSLPTLPPTLAPSAAPAPNLAGDEDYGILMDEDYDQSASVLPRSIDFYIMMVAWMLASHEPP